MAEINDYEDLIGWLKVRPRSDAIVLAARAALRLAPIVLDPPIVNPPAYYLPIFRAMAVIWVSSLDPRSHVRLKRASAEAVPTLFEMAENSDLRSMAPFAIRTLAIATKAVSDDDIYAIWGPGNTIAGTKFEPPEALGELLKDVSILESGMDSKSLAASQLWTPKAFGFWTQSAESARRLPPRFSVVWPMLKSELLAADEGWEVWTDWYEARLDGRPVDKALEEARVLIDPKLWDQGPKAVNAEIKRLIEEQVAKRTPLAQRLSVNPKTGRIRAEPPGRRQTIGKGVSHTALVRNLCEKAAGDITYLREPQRWNQFSVLERQFDIIDDLLKERRLRPERLHDAFQSTVRAIDARLEDRLLDSGHDLDELRADMLHGMSDLRHQFPDLDTMIEARSKRRPKALTPEEAAALVQVVGAVERILERQLKIALREDAGALKQEAAELPPEARNLPLPEGETKNRVYRLVGTLVRVKAILRNRGAELVQILDKGVDAAKKVEAYQKAFEKLEPLWKPIWELLRRFLE